MHAIVALFFNLGDVIFANSLHEDVITFISLHGFQAVVNIAVSTTPAVGPNIPTGVT